MKIKLSLLISFLFGMGFSFSQITVTGGLTGQQLAEVLAGTNITVSNVTLNGSPLASGSFTSSNGFDFESGIILSTGKLINCPGPNDDPNTSDNLGYLGDAQMELLGGSNSWDAIWLEFDFLVQSSSVQFEYIFASEDYPEAAPPNNPTFNDVFAFFISGPGITGEENIALIPGTSDLVSIDNVNAVTNQQYFVDNTGGQEIQFDGYTTPLIAFRNNLVACETYHLKLIISDIHNTNRNSAVFLKENSFVQENVLGVETQTVNSDGIALEGCIEGSFTFAFDQISNQDRIINYSIGGSAVNGVDYAYLDTTITIPAGETAGTIYIDAFSDGLPEGQEFIYLIYPSGGCVGGLDTAVLYIDDSQPIDFELDGIDLTCYNDNSGQIVVNATGGFPAYTYVVTDENGDSFETTVNPITGLAAGEYSVQVYDTYGCKADALVIGGIYDADTTFLPDGNGVTYEAPLVISGFGGGQTINDVSQVQQICLTMEHSYLGDLWIRVESPTGQVMTLKPQNGGGSCDLGEPIATGPVDGASQITTPGVGYEYCFNASPVLGTMVDESNNFFRNYTDGTGNNYSDNYLPSGSYTPFDNFSNLLGSTLDGTWKVYVTDQWGQDNGYIFNWYISLIGDAPDTMETINEPEEIVISGFVANSTCNGSDGSINVTVSNDVGNYTYQWSSGQNTQDLNNISAGVYTLTVTDPNGCSSEHTFVVNNIGTLNITGAVTNVTCLGGSDGGINITPTGGSGGYSYSWSSGEGTEDITDLTAGSYIISITDGNGCLFSQSFNVGDGEDIDINLVSLSNEQCNTDNGSIDISVGGGSGSYGYQWSNGASSQDLTNLNAGNYTVNIIDGNGCTAQQTFSIINNLTNCSSFCYLDIELSALENESCGQANGSIDVNILNAVQPYVITWSNGSNQVDLDNLSAGTYSVNVTDANNCSVDVEFTIVNEADLSIVSSAITNENCGDGNGSIELTVEGGALPYSFLWSNGEQSENLNNLSADEYSITVTDGNNCSVNATFTVENNSGSLSLSGNTSNATCSNANGAIAQYVSGASGAVTYQWSNGSNSQNLNNVIAGDYSCTVSDASGCSVTNNYTIGQTSGDVSLSGSNVTNEVCGNSQGAVNITLTGNNLSYAWSNGANTEDLSGLSAGSYYCIVTNASGCSITTPTFNVINSSGTLNVSTQLLLNEICSNQEGSINLNISGGNQPYTFNWSNGSINEDLINLSAGIYTVQVTDAIGCAESHSYTIQNTSGTLNIASAVVTDESCGASDGSIDISISGGNLPYTFDWSDGSASEDLINVPGGVYDLAISDNEGCVVQATYQIDNEANGMDYNIVLSNEICSNANGYIDLSVTGGSGNYTFNWSNAEITEDIASLASGDYLCQITDDLGCSITTETFVVNNTSLGMTASAIVTDAVCANDGAVDLTVIGGQGPFNFNWSNGDPNEDPTALPAGTYTYVVTDDNGCELTGSVTVNQSNAGLSYSQLHSEETCNASNGFIDLEVTGGDGNYSYLWSNFAITEDLSGLGQGAYSCQITDGNGCMINTDQVNISNSGGGLTISNASITNEVCTNGLGAIDITTTGGQSPIDFSWSNLEVSEDITNLSSGNYSLTITDGLGCEVTEEFTVNSSSGTLQITQGVVSDESCGNADGSINISVQGGVNPTYLWSNGEITQDINALDEGTYQVTVSDANGCTVQNSYTVENNGSNLIISNSTISEDQCGSGSGSISVVASGGEEPYNYSWSNGGVLPTIGNLAAGTYVLTLAEGNGCSIQATFTVNNNVGDLSVTAIVTDESCGAGDGAIDVIPSGGNGSLSYSWLTGENTQDLSGLSQGTYSVNVSDIYGCSVDLTQSVANITNGLTIVVESVSDENCGQADGAIDITVSGAALYTTSWSNGAGTDDLTGISEGIYTVTVTDDLGCEAQETVSVANISGSLQVTFQNIQNENCGNGQGSIDIEVAGAGGYTYAWSDSQITQDAVNLSAGNYEVVITDITGCEITESFTVSNVNNTNLTVNEVISNAYCGSSNGSIVLNTTGGVGAYLFDWNIDGLGDNDDTENQSNLSAGNYSVRVSDEIGCSVNFDFTVDDMISPLAFDDIQIEDEFCGNDNGDIQITSSDAIAYYIDGTPTASFIFALSSGDYLLTIEDAFGCSVDSLVTVGADAFFNVTDVTTNESCGASDGAINISVSGGGGGGGFSYLWSTGQTTQDISGISAGTYTVTVTGGGGGGCSLDYVVVLTNTETFGITEVITDEFCGDGTGAVDLNLDFGSGVTYDWSTGDNSQDLNGLNSGTYTLIVTDPAVGGCIHEYEYEVLNQTSGMIVSGIVTNELCNDVTGMIDLDVVGGSGTYSYSWSTGPNSEDLSGLGAGDYTVTVIDQSDNCTWIGTYSVINDNWIFAGSGNVVNATCAACTDGSVDITLQIPGSYTYSWNSGENTEDLENVLPGTYTVTILSSAGCDTTMSFVVLNSASLEEEDLTIGINIFPNPATSEFTVNYKIPSNGEAILTLMEISGKVIAVDVVNGEGAWIYDSSHLANGMYFIEVRTDQSSRSERLLINLNK